MHTRIFEVDDIGLDRNTAFLERGCRAARRDQVVSLDHCLVDKLVDRNPVAPSKVDRTTYPPVSGITCRLANTFNS